jgi:uncharacterized protein (DUF305 family)
MLSRLDTAPRWVRPTLGALAALVLLSLAFVGGMFYQQLAAPGDNSPEAGFARDMSTHHSQAIGMAMIAYQHGTHAEVTTQAYKIATGQQYEIGVMSDWLDQWHDGQTSTRPAMAWMPNGTKELNADGLMPGMATAAEMDELRNAKGKQVDILFCQLMIRHHLGGIHMIDGLLQVSHNAQVRDLASRMKATQGNEIEGLQRLLEQLNKEP